MYKVVAIRKSDKKEHIYAKGLTKRAAEKICESWGWSYRDEKGVGYWLDYELDLTAQLKTFSELAVVCISFSSPILLTFFG